MGIRTRREPRKRKQETVRQEENREGTSRKPSKDRKSRRRSGKLGQQAEGSSKMREEKDPGYNNMQGSRDGGKSASVCVCVCVCVGGANA